MNNPVTETGKKLQAFGGNVADYVASVHSSLRTAGQKIQYLEKTFATRIYGNMSRGGFQFRVGDLNKQINDLCARFAQKKWGKDLDACIAKIDELKELAENHAASSQEKLWVALKGFNLNTKPSQGVQFVAYNPGEQNQDDDNTASLIDRIRWALQPQRYGQGGSSVIFASLPTESQLNRSLAFIATSSDEIMKAFGVTKEQADNLRAAMAMVSYAEGTANERGYYTTFGYDYCYNVSDGHPGISKQSRWGATSAFGKYQFMRATWNGKATGGNPSTPMYPKNQDFACINLFKVQGVYDDIINGDIEKAFQGLAREWASIPRYQGDTAGCYGQSVKSYDQLLNIYRGYKKIAGGDMSGGAKYTLA